MTDPDADNLILQRARTIAELARPSGDLGYPISELVESPTHGIVAMVARWNYISVLGKRENDGLDWWKDAEAWKKENGWQPPFVCIRKGTSAENYDDINPLFSLGNFLVLHHKEKTLDEVWKGLEKSGVKREELDGVTSKVRHLFFDLDTPQPYEVTIDRLVPELRSLFTADWVGFDKKPAKRVLFLPPLGANGKLKQLGDEHHIQCWLIQAQDNGDRAYFAHFLDADWQLLADRHPEWYRVPAGRDLPGRLGRGQWWSLRPEEEAKWASDLCYRFHRPYFGRYSEDLHNEGTPTAQAEKCFMLDNCSLYHVPVFASNLLLGILAFMQPPSTSKDANLLDKPPVRKCIFDIVNRHLLGTRLALSATRQTNMGELAWFLRHNVGSTHIGPARMRLDALEAQVKSGQYDDTDISEQFADIRRGLSDIEYSIDALIPVHETRPNESDAGIANAIPDLDAYLVRFLSSQARLLAHRETRTEDERLRLTFVILRRDLLRGCPIAIPETVLEMALQVLIANAVRAYIQSVETLGRPLDLYTSDDPARIVVRGYVSERGSSPRIRGIEIEDYGIGMPGWKREQIQGLLEQVAIDLPIRFTPERARHLSAWSGTGIGIFSAARALARYGIYLTLLDSVAIDDAPHKNERKPLTEGGHGSRLRLEWHSDER